MQMARFTPPKIIDDNNTTLATKMDSASKMAGPKMIENLKLKYKILFLDKTKNSNTILVNKAVYRRQD